MSTQVQPHFGMKVKIKATSALFPGHMAAIAYIGEGGVSVYLLDSEFDDCIPLNNDEWEPAT